MFRRSSVVSVVAMAVACGTLQAASDEGDGDGGADGSAPEGATRDDGDVPDGPVALERLCNVGAPFGPSKELPVAGAIGLDSLARLSPNELDMWFGRAVVAGGATRIHHARRSKATAPFDAVVDVFSVNDAVDAAPDGNRTHPWVDVSGTRMFFTVADPGVRPPSIWTAVRDGDGGFGAVEPVDFGDAAVSGLTPFGTPNAGSLYFSRTDVPGQLSVADRVSGTTFGGVRGVAVVDAAAIIGDSPVISFDGFELFYRDASGSGSMYLVTRTQLTQPFGDAQTLSGVAATVQTPGWISPDGCRFYFAADGRIYVAARTPA